MAWLAWRAEPPDETAEEVPEEGEDADVVDLATRRLAGWLKAMFGGTRKPPGGGSEANDS